MQGWSEFYLGQVGASAALGGLVFVGLSINLAKIMASPHLPDRAMVALVLLLSVLLVASLALAPGQRPSAFGAEALGVGLAAWAGVSWLHARTMRKVEPEFRAAAITGVLLGQACAILLWAGGAQLMAGMVAGAYVLGTGVLLIYVLVFIHAWVLLVEINR